MLDKFKKKFYILIPAVTYPSGKGTVCKTVIPRFESGCHLLSAKP